MRHWVQVRAGLILLAIVIGLIDGCPTPREKRVPEPLRGVVQAGVAIRREILRPLRPVRELFRLRQQYRLFPTAKLEQHLLWVEARTAGSREWRILYRPHDDEHAFMADRFEYRRLRGAWNPGTRGQQGGYGPFAQWVAGLVFESDPTIDRVRVRLEKIQLDPEIGGYHTSGEFEGNRVERRSKWQQHRAGRPVKGSPR